MRDRMPAWLAAEWRLFAAREPWGFDAEWDRAGVVAASVCNANPFRGKDSKPVKPEDFKPKFVRKKQKRFTSKLSPEEERESFILGFAQAFGASFFSDGVEVRLTEAVTSVESDEQ